MTDLSRRTALKGALAASAALALPQIMTRAAFAKAPMMEPTSETVNRVKLGSFDVTTVLDASRVQEGPFPAFGANASEEAVQTLMKENQLPPAEVQFYFTPVVVNTGDEVVLFDTGLGGDAGQLAARLAEAGYAPDTVDKVVITHFHPDHIGGLSDASGTPVFPNATYVAGEAEYEAWTADAMASGPAKGIYDLVQAKVVPLRDRMTLVGDDAEVAKGIRSVAAFGHTPGHMAFHIEDGGQRLLLTADAANHFVAALQRPDWHFVFDFDKDAAVATRRRLFDMAATDAIPFTGYHMPFPALGFVEKQGEGFRYVPETYQFETRG